MKFESYNRVECKVRMDKKEYYNISKSEGLLKLVLY